MTAGEAVVLRDGSWAATLAAVFVCTLVRAQCMKPSRLATLFACLLGAARFSLLHWTRTSVRAARAAAEDPSPRRDDDETSGGVQHGTTHAEHHLDATHLAVTLTRNNDPISPRRRSSWLVHGATLHGARRLDRRPLAQLDLRRSRPPSSPLALLLRRPGGRVLLHVWRPRAPGAPRRRGPDGGTARVPVTCTPVGPAARTQPPFPGPRLPRSAPRRVPQPSATSPSARVILGHLLTVGCVSWPVRAGAWREHSGRRRRARARAAACLAAASTSKLTSLPAVAVSPYASRWYAAV